MKLLTINYAPDEENLEYIPESKVLDYVKKECDRINADKKIKHIRVTGQSIVVTAFRLAIAKGWISPEDIGFYYNNHYIHPNKYGVLSEYPDGFCDYEDKLNSEILEVWIEIPKDKKGEK